MTLVVSSHILAELEDYSDRMVIVDHGRIVGGETITLRAAQGGVRVTLAVVGDGLAEALVRGGRGGVESSDRHAVAVLAGGAEARAALLAGGWCRGGFAVSDFTEETRNLEEVYFSKVKT